MRVHFTNLFGQSPRSVALIAQNDTMKIAKELGANELAIYFYDNSQESSGELNSRLDGIVAGVSYGDIVFFFFRIDMKRCLLLPVENVGETSWITSKDELLLKAWFVQVKVMRQIPKFLDNNLFDR